MTVALSCVHFWGVSGGRSERRAEIWEPALLRGKESCKARNPTGVLFGSIQAEQQRFARPRRAAARAGSSHVGPRRRSGRAPPPSARTGAREPRKRTYALTNQQGPRKAVDGEMARRPRDALRLLAAAAALLLLAATARAEGGQYGE